LCLDIPNMLFNFALVSSWFPHLSSMLAEHELPALTSPCRLDSSRFSNKSRNPGYRYDVSVEKSLNWFRDRIRPAVMEWTAKDDERQKSFRASVFDVVSREASEIESDPTVIETKRREKLLADFKNRVRDENGNEVRNYALYNAWQHSMHKP